MEPRRVHKPALYSNARLHSALQLEEGTKTATFLPLNVYFFGSHDNLWIYCSLLYVLFDYKVKKHRKSRCRGVIDSGMHYCTTLHAPLRTRPLQLPLLCAQRFRCWRESGACFSSLLMISQLLKPFRLNSIESTIIITDFEP